MAIEILAYEDTPLGVLCLRRRDLLSDPGTSVTEVTLDHEFLMSSYLTESERTLTTIGLQMVQDFVRDPDRKLRVLVGGLGLGYTAAEALLCDKVESIEVVEFLPEVIGWMNDGLVPLSDRFASESRLTITQGDIYARVAQPPPKHRVDLIAIDVDHSPQDMLGDQSQGFYTVDGLRRAMGQLNPGGVLGVWSYAEDTPLLENMKQVFVDVEVRQVTVWNDLIDVEQTDWLFFGRHA